VRIWIDAQLSPAIAAWINRNYSNIEAESLSSLGLRDAKDLDIFLKAKEADAVIRTKDSDFLFLLDKFEAPPKIILISSGNTSNKKLKKILTDHMDNIIHYLQNGEILIEINDRK